MWDEKNLRTGMTWLKQASAIGRFRRPSALEFSGLQRGLTMFFPTCQVRVVRFYVSCLLLLLPRPPLVLLSSSSSSPPRPPRPPCHPCHPCRPLVVLVVLVVLLVLLLNCDSRSTVFAAGTQPRPSTPSFPAGPQPRPSTPSVPCRTSTASIHAQCSLPDLNHDHPRPVFPAGPQPRVSTPSVPCRTSCRKIWDKECAEES